MVKNLPHDTTKIHVEVERSVGIVGYAQGKLTCYVCSRVSCVHTDFVDKNKAKDTYPPIMELISKNDSVRPRYKRACLSHKPIPFNGSDEYEDLLLSRPSDYLKLSEPFVCEASACKACGKDLATASQKQEFATLVSYFEIHDASGK